MADKKFSVGLPAEDYPSIMETAAARNGWRATIRDDKKGAIKNPQTHEQYMQMFVRELLLGAFIAKELRADREKMGKKEEALKKKYNIKQ